MIETRACVVAIKGGQVWVEASSPQGCAACQAQGNCGLSRLGRYLAGNQSPLAVAAASDPTIQPGDTLVLSLAESELLRAGLLAYLLPAGVSVLGAIVASLAGLGDAGAAASMLTGFAAGLAIARAFSRPAGIQVSRLPPRSLETPHE